MFPRASSTATIIVAAGWRRRVYCRRSRWQFVAVPATIFAIVARRQCRQCGRAITIPVKDLLNMDVNTNIWCLSSVRLIATLRSAAGATRSTTSSAGTRIPTVPGRASEAGQSVLLPENMNCLAVGARWLNQVQFDSPNLKELSPHFGFISWHNVSQLLGTFSAETVKLD